MLNNTLFPFIRNQYFFGKLLTQRDMEAEQDYFNNKRRLFNMLFCGSGVVCGLNVLKIDGVTVAVESGLALDGLGRELAVCKPVITRLSELEGFDGDRGISPYVYLCAEYAEAPREPVHAMADAATAENRYGKVEEGVRFYLRYGEPEPFEIARAHPDKSVGRRSESIEKRLERGCKERLYIAKIHLIRWDEAYEIEKIEMLPFKQTAALPGELDIPAAEPSAEPPSAASKPAAPEPAVPPVNAFGTTEIHIPAGAKYDSLHYSEEIPHGLGFSGVYVTAGLLNETGAIFGHSSIFHEKSGYEWAVKTHDADGTFQIGVRVKTVRPETILHFTWMASINPGQARNKAERPQIVVTPGIQRLTLRQSQVFAATVHGLPDKDVVWSIREQDGGSITRDGCYVAPNTEGVFTVYAASPSQPGIIGAAYVIVSDL